MRDGMLPCSRQAEGRMKEGSPVARQEESDSKSVERLREAARDAYSDGVLKHCAVFSNRWKVTRGVAAGVVT